MNLLGRDVGYGNWGGEYVQFMRNPLILMSLEELIPSETKATPQHLKTSRGRIGSYTFPLHKVSVSLFVKLDGQLNCDSKLNCTLPHKKGGLRILENSFSC